MRSCGTPRIECATCDSVVSRPWPCYVRADLELQRAVRREAGMALLVARHQRDAPGGVHAGAVAGLLGVHGEADADAAPVGLAARWRSRTLAEADGLDGPAQRLGIVAGVEMALGDVVERHLRRAAPGS